MKRVALTLHILAMVLLLPRTADAKYAQMCLVNLIGRADIVVSGFITEVHETTFGLGLNQILLGRPATQKDKKTVLFHKFRDWTCAVRWGKYTVGERVLIFAYLRPEDNGIYSILGAGGEGEMRVHEGIAYFSRGRSPQGIETASIDIDGVSVYGAKLPLKDLADAISGLHKLFDFEKVSICGVTVISKNDEDALDLYRNKSKVHKALGEEAAARTRN